MKETFSYNKEHMAKVVGRSLPISTKFAVEISSTIRNKRLIWAKNLLSDVIALKKAVAMKKFRKDIAHKKGVGPGKYPIKASQEILRLLEAVEANAQFKGLNTADLVLCKVVANKAAKQWHYGRQRRRKMKRTNVEIVVKEAKKVERQTKVKKEDKK